MRPCECAKTAWLTQASWGLAGPQVTLAGMAIVTIKRILSSVRGRSDAVAFNGMGFVVAYDPDAAKGPHRKVSS